MNNLIFTENFKAGILEDKTKEPSVSHCQY